MANRQKRFEAHRLRMTQESKVELTSSQVEAEFEEYDYLRLYPAPMKKAIIESLTAGIPLEEFPPITPATISLHRRAGNKIFKTKMSRDGELDPHMTFESLSILS